MWDRIDIDIRIRAGLSQRGSVFFFWRELKTNNEKIIFTQVYHHYTMSLFSKPFISSILVCCIGKSDWSLLDARRVRVTLFLRDVFPIIWSRNVQRFWVIYTYGEKSNQGRLSRVRWWPLHTGSFTLLLLLVFFF